MIQSWLPISKQSDFSIQNMPLGVFSATPMDSPRCATVLGETVIDLAALEEAGLFQGVKDLSCNVFNQPTLNAFIEHPHPVWIRFRQRLVQIFMKDGKLKTLRTDQKLQGVAFFALKDVTMHLPIQIGDYTDFYASREHATNVGSFFRSKEDALNPNWLHLPVGYHGRASTVVVSGQEVRRPKGQLLKDPEDQNAGSVHEATRRLDFELEVAAIVGGPANPIGHPLPIELAKDRIFGYVLMNDWSARDIQVREYVPLGPFTSKNFCTTISPWIVMKPALDAFKAPTSAVVQKDPVPLDYLQDSAYSSYDINLSVDIVPQGQSDATTVSKSNFRNVYWNPVQQLTHHTVSGCSMKAGDLLGSGTISGTGEQSFGSMLELSWNGTKDIAVGESTRKFLEDGDTVILRGFCENEQHGRIGFGSCVGKILPALDEEEEDDDADFNEKKIHERYTELKLHAFWRSSSSWRVRIALAAKGIKHSTIPVDILLEEHKSPEFLSMNPLGEVPVLEYKDSATKKVAYLTNSLAIIYFLDTAFPTRQSMIPKDPEDRAIAMELVETLNSLQQNVFLLGTLEKETKGKINAVKQARALNMKGLKDFELLLERQRQKAPGPYCMGTFSPTIVDAVLVPQLYNARRFGLDTEKEFPILAMIDSKCSTHPWFIPAEPSKQPDAQKDF